MKHDDVQPPEFIAERLGADGRIHRVPFLDRREGETRDEFLARMNRVRDSLQPQPLIGRGAIPLHHLIMICIVGLVLWWAIWRFFR